MPLTVLADGHAIAVPLRLLDHDDGWLNFKILTASWLREVPEGPVTTHVLDFMPDIGLAPGTTGTSPLPAAPAQVMRTIDQP